MKINKSIVLKITVIVALLAAVAVLLRLSSDTLRLAPYNPATATPKKYEMLKRWLPTGADFIAISDTYRLASIPELKNFLEEGLFKGSDTAIKAINSLLNSQTKIGMIAMCATLGDTGVPVSFFVIVQGDFREGKFVEYIKGELAKENLLLSSQESGKIAIYSQEGAEALFAFAIPDRNHLIVGTKAEMTAFFEKPSVAEKLFPFFTTDSPFFGFLKASDRIRKVLPPQFSSLELAKFWADDNKWLHALIDCSDIEQAQNFRMFLSGMKALYMLQSESNKMSVDALAGIAIGGEGATVQIDAPLEQLPNIFPNK